MKHLFKKNSFGLILNRQYTGSSYSHCSITNTITNKGVHYLGNTGNDYTFPLYLYQDDNTLENQRTPNLNPEIIKEIQENLGLVFVPEKEENKESFSPIDLLDYIYAVLHSPAYREKYKEFLKIDFPRVPYPDPKTFWKLVEFGKSLRGIHLLEDKTLDERVIDISGEGEMTITNKLNKKDFTITDEKVSLSINEKISIVNIPQIAWEFYIGGYQPAQKWLKDRVGRELTRSDMKHYNRIINALTKTDEIMIKIDKVVDFS
ncbi:MAG: hypothetical protein OIF32_04070, partial [Campylobacterales bacterium]|nr:hypothetical protein [Campylobacterales bacterium]